MADTPTLDRILEVKSESQAIGAFLEWLRYDQDLVIAEWANFGLYADSPDELIVANLSIEKILARYFDIDLDEAERERQALIDAWKEEMFTDEE